MMMIVIMLTCVRQVIIGRDRMSPRPALYQYQYIYISIVVQSWYINL